MTSQISQKAKKSGSWKVWFSFIVVMASFITIYAYRFDIKTAVDKINVEYNNSHPNFYLKNPVQLEDMNPENEYFMDEEDLEFFEGFEKRDDKSLSSKKSSLKKSSSSSSSDSSSSSSNTSTPIYDQSGIRFLSAMGGIVLLNMLAIFIHHIFHKLSSNETKYSSMLKVISTF